MKKSILFLFFLLMSGMIWGQQLPCLPFANGTTAGDEPPGCVMCGIAFSGTTIESNPFIIKDLDFPCGDEIQSNVFVTVYSDSTGEIEISFIHSDCISGVGLRAIIYDQNFNLVSNCGISSGVGLPIPVIAENLTPYTKHYLMISGIEGAECNFLLINAGELFPPIDSIPTINSPLDSNITCVGQEVCYTVNKVKYAEGYTWEIPANAILISGGTFRDTFACLQFIAPGAGGITVAPYHPCQPSPTTLLINTVTPIPPSVKPPIEVCPFDMPFVLDTLVFENYGPHWITKANPQGCDSTILYTIVPKIQRPIRRDEVICSGEFIQIDTFIIDTTGMTQLVVGTQANGCDSLVLLDLIVVDSLNSVDIQCEFDGTALQLSWDEQKLFDKYNIFIDGSPAVLDNNSLSLTGPFLFTTFVSVVPQDGNGCVVGPGTVIIDPNNLPIADFEIENTTCVETPTIVRFTGAASPSATFEWNFGAATIVSGSGRGPFLLRWETPGNYDVSLEIDGRNCLSQPVTQTIEVQPKLPQPEFFCIADSQKIVVGWQQVSGASDYQIDVLTGQSGNFNPQLNILSASANGNNSATFLVTAVGDVPCLNNLDTLTCRLDDCPPPSPPAFDFEPLCQGGLNQVFPLPTITPDSSQRFRWVGEGVNDNAFWVTSPDLVAGANMVYYFTEVGNCTYLDSLPIEVVPVPSNSFVIESPTCQNDTIEVYYRDTARFHEGFSWRLDGAQIIDGQGFMDDPWQLVWDELGPRELSLKVIDRGCESQRRAQTINISEPNEEVPFIICSMDTAQLYRFEWSSIPRADEYEIYINGDSIARIDSTEFLVLWDSLGADSIHFLVQPIGQSACPFPSGETTCGGMVSTGTTFDESQLKISPNPSTGLFSLHAKGGQGSGNDVMHSLQVIDPSGKLLLSQNVNARRAEIDLGHLPKGIYFLRVEGADWTRLERVALIR